MFVVFLVFFLSVREGKAEAQEVFFAVGLTAIPVGNAATCCVIIPTAATIDAIGARRGSFGIHLSVGIVIAILVVAPLPDVSGHVIDAQLVGGLGGNRLSAIALLTACLARNRIPIPCDRSDVIAAGLHIARKFLPVR